MSAAGLGVETSDLFPDLLSAEDVASKVVMLRPLKRPVWSNQKAMLIERYLGYFVMITKHGTYIDGFAGPQAPDHDETWSAKRVLERRPRFLRNFFLCELDPVKVDALEALWAAQPPKENGEAKRQCHILPGDFNLRVDDILAGGTITEKEATFALLDQRTFECHWSTVQKLARHKKSGNKIELFYFLAVKWLHRSFAGIQVNTSKVDLWWGNSEWRDLAAQSQVDIAKAVTQRMKSELGYRYALPFPIYEKDQGNGAVMYYMIHASDHEAAHGLMWRAYNQAVTTPKPEQGALDFIQPDN